MRNFFFLTFLIFMVQAGYAKELSSEKAYISLYYASAFPDYDGREGVNVIINGSTDGYLIKSFTFTTQVEPGEYDLTVANSEFSTNTLKFEVAKSSTAFIVIESGQIKKVTPDQYSRIKNPKSSNETSIGDIVMGILAMPFALVAYLFSGD